MLAIFIQGLTLGFSAGVTPGPFQAFLLSQSLKNGWKRTLPAAFAPLLSDGPIIFIVLVILTQMPDWFIQVLQLVGGIFILYLAWGAYKTFRAPLEALSPKETGQQTILQATLINALNPNPYIFWSTLAGPILIMGWREAPPIGISFIFGFYLLFILVLMGMILIFAKARTLGPRVTQILNGIAALALLLFGLNQLYRALSLH